MSLTPEEEYAYWDDRLTTLRRSNLGSVQAAASGWAKVFGSLLAVFSTVAFAGGLSSIGELPTPWSVVARLLTAVAALAASGALLFSGLASQSLSVAPTPDLSPLAVRDQADALALRSRGRLAWAKVLGAIAAGCVLGGSLLILAVGAGGRGSGTAVLVVVDGTLHCGELERAGGTLRVDDVALDRGVDSAVVITRCPSP